MQPFNQIDRKIVILSLLIIGLLGMVSASSVTIDNNEFWDNEDNEVTGSFDCSESGTLMISKDGNNRKTTNSDFSFSVSEIVDLGGYGGYDADLTCKNGSTDSESFKIKKLVINWVDQEGKTVYQGTDFKAYISSRIEGGSMSGSLDSSTFNSRFLDYGFIDSYSVGGTKNGDTIVKYEVPEESEIEPGKKTLVTEVEYDSSGQTVKAETGVREIYVQKPWNVEILNKTPETGKISYQELSSNIGAMSVKVNITEKGNPRNKLASNDFYLTITKNNSTIVEDEAEWIERELIGEGTYRLTLKGIPTNLDLGSYSFEIGLDRDDGTRITDFNVNHYIVLGGKITDAQGSPVNANIKAEDNGFIRSFQMKSKGEYRGQLLPGNYNFTVNFPDVNAIFKDVKLQEGVKGAIRYDDIPTGELENEVEGVSIVNAVGIIFGYPFESSEIEMSYDPSRVNFEHVRVLECKGWSFGRSCSTEWKSLDLDSSQIYPTVGKVVFDANPVNISEGRKKMLNAYMVVRNTELISQSLKIDNRRVPKGSIVPVTGKIITPNQQGVGDVDVTVSVVKDGKTLTQATATTRSNGVFGAQVPAPEEEGTYFIKVEAREDPYIGFTKKLDRSFATYTERKVNIRVPDTVEFYPGEEAETSFTIINGGQAALENVKFRVNGLKNSWYEFNQGSWDRIGPGGSREAVMFTTLPEDYCGDTCQQYPKFKVEAIGESGGDSINSIKTVQTVVTKEKEAQSQNAPNTNTGEVVEAGAIDRKIQATGDFLASQGSLNIALSLITVFLVSLVAAVKKKTGDGNRSQRNAISRGSGGRAGSGNSQSRVQRPKVISDEEESHDHEETEERRVQEKEQESGSEEENDKFVCDECGEQFDSETALELHKDINQG